MREICQSGSEGGAKLTFVPTPILAQEPVGFEGGTERWLASLIRKPLAFWTGSSSSAARRNSSKGQAIVTEELAQ
jgi:hypothetical protein